MKDALLHCLTGNIKFKLAIEKWLVSPESASTGDKHSKSVAEFIERASQQFMVKQMPLENLIKKPQEAAEAATAEVEMKEDDTIKLLNPYQLSSMIKYSIVRNFESSDQWVSVIFFSSLIAVILITLGC